MTVIAISKSLTERIADFYFLRSARDGLAFWNALPLTQRTILLEDAERILGRDASPADAYALRELGILAL